MSTMQILPPTSDIEAALTSCGKKETHNFAGAFRKGRAENPEAGWALLEQVFGFHFRPSNASEPFAPQMRAGDKRSMIPEDLSDSELDALAGSLGEIDDPEYRARICDVLWLRRRDPNAARMAVDAYLASGSRLEDPEHWVSSMERYQRAARLARQIEPKGELPKKVLAHLEARVFHYDGRDPLYFSLKALEILEEFAFGDFARLAEIAGRVAAHSRANGNFDKARSYNDIQARLLKRAKQPELAEVARVASAECFFEEAEARERGGSFMAAHVFSQKALSAFRDRPSLRPRIPEVQKRMAIAGQKTLDEMQAHSTEIDLRDAIQHSKRAVADQPIDDAFLSFLHFIPLLDPTKIRKQVLDSMAAHPLQSHFDAEMFDAAGRKVGRRPAISDDPEQYELTVRGFMEQHAALERGVRVAGYIAPAMHQLLSEHDIDDAVISSLLSDSELIPAERLPLIVQGVSAGFRWDFSTALHLLIPQIENGLREMLSHRNVTARNMDENGVEEVWSYERVLSHTVTRETLGEPLVFELESLLVGRLGPNLRNLVAHGLLSPNALNSDIACYLWWLLVRLMTFPTSKFQDFLHRKRSNNADGRGSM